MFKEKNTKSTVNPAINTKEFDFKKLSEYIGKEIRLYGFFFTKGKFGKQVVAVTKDCLVNLPARCVEDFENFTDEEIDAIKSGKMVLVNIAEFDSESGKTVIFDYDDCDAPAEI